MTNIRLAVLAQSLAELLQCYAPDMSPRQRAAITETLIVIQLIRAQEELPLNG